MDNQRHELDDFFLCVADFVPAIKNLKNGYEAILRFGYDVNKVRPETLIDADDEFYHRLANDFKAASDSIRSGCPLILTDSNSKLKRDIYDLVGLYTNRPKPKENVVFQEAVEPIGVLL